MRDGGGTCFRDWRMRRRCRLPLESSLCSSPCRRVVAVVLVVVVVATTTATATATATAMIARWW